MGRNVAFRSMLSPAGRTIPADKSIRPCPPAAAMLRYPRGLRESGRPRRRSTPAKRRRASETRAGRPGSPRPKLRKGASRWCSGSWFFPPGCTPDDTRPPRRSPGPRRRAVHHAWAAAQARGSGPGAPGKPILELIPGVTVSYTGLTTQPAARSRVDAGPWQGASRAEGG